MNSKNSTQQEKELAAETRMRDLQSRNRDLTEQVSTLQQTIQKMGQQLRAYKAQLEALTDDKNNCVLAEETEASDKEMADDEDTFEHCSIFRPSTCKSSSGTAVKTLVEKKRREKRSADFHKKRRRTNNSLSSMDQVHAQEYECEKSYSAWNDTPARRSAHTGKLSLFVIED